MPEYRPTPSGGLQRLLAMPRFSQTPDTAYAPGQDRIRGLLATMGDPHVSLPVVHIGGTNGKGSTASYVSALGTASGLRVGLFTSPSLLRTAEMIRIDGVPQDEALSHAADRWIEAIEASGATFFEAVTALAFGIFAEAGVDLAVVEVGLGGRDDATAVVEP
ncbi:MAG: bifunctional folylpolyglutamate synthase/dihydrofolate synthase, partial [Bacteroidota bacterium]